MWELIRQQWDYYVLSFLVAFYLVGAVLLAATLFWMISG